MPTLPADPPALPPAALPPAALSTAAGGGLPPRFARWFAARGWALNAHQALMLARKDERATLLIAPTGGGKTLAGFLPSLIELAGTPRPGLHTLYVSPLKALAADIRRNLTGPVAEIGLDIRVEDRTGDTPARLKKAQRVDPPQILLTTPESLALLLSYPDAPRMLAGLSRVIVDEIHALAESRRGDQLMLALSRLETLAPSLRRVGLSATVEDPPALARYLARHPDPCPIVAADPGPEPDVAMLETRTPPPWSGGGGTYGMAEVLREVRRHRTTLIFHNTRAQAEIFFHALWMQNHDNLPVAIHHGALSREQRQKVEAAMQEGALRAVVCTGTLDLGIDWNGVDLVIQIGAPKNIKRLVQRIGRANHRANTASKALILPANRFEVVECAAALDAVRARALDGEARGPGPRDVLCQHILIVAASGPFDADGLYAEVRRCGAYAGLSRAGFDACLDLVATGGYALRAYDRWQRLVRRDGLWHLRDPRAAALIRMNIGTIEERGLLDVRVRGRGEDLGRIEEDFAATLSPGDTFLMGGKVVRFESLTEVAVLVSEARGRKPRIATFSGTRFATSTQLSARILDLMARESWPSLPPDAAAWLALQREVSRLPRADRLLVESFRWNRAEHTCVHGFAGRNAMQTLGLLLTRRMEELALHPLGFVATDYAVLVWGLDPVPDPAVLFDPEALRHGFEDWLAANAVMKRSFRTVATVAGTLARIEQGRRRAARQASLSAGILYDTLRRHDPGHLLLEITREEAQKGLVDFGRIEEMLARTGGRVDHVVLDRVSPMAAPLLFEMGRVPVTGAAEERLLREEAAELMRLAGAP